MSHLDECKLNLMQEYDSEICDYLKTLTLSVAACYYNDEPLRYARVMATWRELGVSTEITIDEPDAWFVQNEGEHSRLAVELADMIYDGADMKQVELEIEQAAWQLADEQLDNMNEYNITKGE